MDKYKEFLYDKQYTCPYCDHQFKYPTLRSGMNKPLYTDIDLYTHYEFVNPLLFEIIVCPHCFYSGFVRSFNTPLLPYQERLLKKCFETEFPEVYLLKIVTVHESVIKHKLALYIAHIKRSSLAEQSYLALKIAWLYRDLGDEEKETFFIKKAYWGFNESLVRETYPILEISEPTAKYITAALAYRLGKFDEANKKAFELIKSTYTERAIKEKAYELRETIKEKKNELQIQELIQV